MSVLKSAFGLGVALVLIAAGSPAAAAPALEGSFEGRAGEDSIHRFDAPSAGAIALAVHGPADLALEVTDEDGQPLQNGRIDVDYDGDLGLELGIVPVPRAGSYRIRVIELGGGTGARYSLSAVFLPFEPFARPEDPQGRPSLAARLQAGDRREGRIDNAAGDRFDWYLVSAPADGTLVVMTRAPGDDVGDLILEAFLDGRFDGSAQRSDQDLQENRANESVSVMVKAGQELHVRVSSPFGGTGAIPYRLSVDFIE